MTVKPAHKIDPNELEQIAFSRREMIEKLHSCSFRIMELAINNDPNTAPFFRITNAGAIEEAAKHIALTHDVEVVAAAFKIAAGENKTFDPFELATIRDALDADEKTNGLAFGNTPGPALQDTEDPTGI